MKKLIILLLLFMLANVGFAQDRIAKGYVLDKVSHAALQGVEIVVEGKASKALTNINGEFVVTVEKGYPTLLISKEGYKDYSIRLKPGFKNKYTKIYLEPLDFKEKAAEKKMRKDSLFGLYKNALSLSILELLQVGIGIRYERFIHPKHSLGLHATYYFYGFSNQRYSNLPLFGEQLVVEYKGIKMTPFYRFYLVRENSLGLFMDAKIPFGYFDFGELEYRYEYSHDTYKSKYTSHLFWTWGVGLSVGFMTRIGKGDHGLLNISLGYQYFPMAKPPEALYEETFNGTGKYETETEWWYQTGPGSSFEVKLTLGGIF